MVPLVGFELTTYRLQGECSTPELKRLWRSYGVTIPIYSSDSAVCVREHFKTSGKGWIFTSNTLIAQALNVGATLPFLVAPGRHIQVASVSGRRITPTCNSQ